MSTARGAQLCQRHNRSGDLLSSRLRAAHVAKRRKTSKLTLCPHCGQMLATKTFKKHKRLYFRLPQNVWIKSGEMNEEGTCINIEVTV